MKTRIAAAAALVVVCLVSEVGFVSEPAVRASSGSLTASAAERPIRQSPGGGYGLDVFSRPRRYGVAWNADGLGNLPIGHWEKRVDIRFRAERQGRLDKIKLFFVFATWEEESQCSRWDCYAAGTGGRVRIEVQADDGTAAHLPSGRVLSSRLLKHPMDRRRAPPVYAVGSGLGGRATANFRVVDVPDVPLVAGRIYHVVFSDPSRRPFHNYISLDNLFVHSKRHQVQPAVTNTSLALLAKYIDKPGWHLRRTDTPVFEIHFANGYVQGQGYMGTAVSNPKPIYQDNRARERIVKVTGGDRRVSKVAVRLARFGSPGPLHIRLERANGVVVGKALVPAHQIGSGYGWVTGSFGKSITLHGGHGYAVVLSAQGDSADGYLIYPLEEGTAGYGFTSPNLFGDGYAQINSGSGWLNHVAGWGGGDAIAFDLQLFLRP